MINTLLVIKPAVIAGLALWLSIACFNNIIDRQTNRSLLKTMLSMELLQADPLGQGLLHRAWKRQGAEKHLLWGIVVIQACISIFLWAAAIYLLMAVFNGENLSCAVNIASLALLSFMGLWLFFLWGGLWFGYWIKMPNAQIVHLFLLVISLLAIIVINLPV